MTLSIYVKDDYENIVLGIFSSPKKVWSILNAIEIENDAKKYLNDSKDILFGNNIKKINEVFNEFGSYDFSIVIYILDQPNIVLPP